ncbi:MAG TPA: hypothetical protein DIT13_05200 [Verrucomicrobiales bacterium]|nr:hypothetical protein [Verrucomicrobiales bacterium]
MVRNSGPCSHQRCSRIPPAQNAQPFRRLAGSLLPWSGQCIAKKWNPFTNRQFVDPCERTIFDMLVRVLKGDVQHRFVYLALRKQPAHFQRLHAHIRLRIPQRRHKQGARLVRIQFRHMIMDELNSGRTFSRFGKSRLPVP